MGCKANERTPRERSRSVTSAEAASRWIRLQPLERYRNICLVSKMCFTSLCLFSFKLKSFFILFLVRSIILSFIQANPHFSPLYHNFSAAKCSENQHKVTRNAEYSPVCASTRLMSLTFDLRAGAGLPLLPLFGWRRGRMCSLARLDGFKKWKSSFCKGVKSLKSGAALCTVEVGEGRRHRGISWVHERDGIPRKHPEKDS